MATRDPGPPGDPGPAGTPVHPGEPRDLDRDVDPAHPYRARQLAPYRRDAGLHDSGLTGRYPGLRAAAAATRASTPPARAPAPTASRSGRRC